jgi:hypothetical protein
MAKSPTARKAKRTFSLSRESLRYLESVQKRRKSGSVSSILDEFIRQKQQAEEMQKISLSITNYYDSLSDEESFEDRKWGEFSETQFPDE